MKKETPNGKRSVSREEWLQLAKTRGSVDPSVFDDEFSRRAVQALRYMPEEADPGTVLKTLDKVIEKNAAPETGNIFVLLKNPAVWLSIAASLLILLIPAAIIFSPANPQIDHEKLYAVYFEPIGSAIPMTGTTRGPENGQTSKNSAINAYENKNYELALGHFQQYLADHPDDQEMTFYYGLSLMASGKQVEALPRLTEVAESAIDENYRHAAIWYLALAYLKTKNEDAAFFLLEELENQSENPFYQKKAKSLLKEFKH